MTRPLTLIEREDSPLPPSREQRARDVLFGGLPEPGDDTSHADLERIVEDFIERRIEAMFAEPNRRGIAELGTYRSKRRAADLLRERDRVRSCVVCGRDIPEATGGSRRRSDARTCSTKCRVALHRRDQKPVSKGAVRPAARNTYEPHLTGSMTTVTRPSPMLRALLLATEEVFGIPMPEGYPDEVEWRRGQAHVIRRLFREERTSGSPDLMRFKRRCRSYINAQKRLTKESNA